MTLFSYSRLHIGLFLWSISLMIGAGACSDSSQISEQKPNAQDPKISDSPFAFIQIGLDQEAQANIRQKLNSWLNFYQIGVEEFRFRDHTGLQEHPYIIEYTANKSVDVQEEAFFPGDRQQAWWEALYAFSPDRRYLLDIHDYTHIHMNDEGQLEIDSEPDSKVDLWDMQEKKVYRIRFCGTACFFEEAVFWSDEIMLLAGFEEDFTTGTFHPFVEFVHIERGESWKFRSPKAKEVLGFAYLRHKLHPYLPQNK